MTTFAQDIADDSDLFDGLTTITLTKEGATSGISVAAVTSSPLRRERAASYGPMMLEGKTRTYSLPVANLAAAIPEPGDTITTADGVWKIVGSDLATLNTRYRCDCYRQI